MPELGALRAVLDALGAAWIDPPVLQPAELYLELSGEDLRRRAFLIADEEGEEHCLRPDMTVPALTAALGQGLRNGVIAYEGLVFRRQAEGSARESEFVQIGAEWLGASDDAAIVAAALACCEAAGAAPLLRLGDIALVEGFIDACGLHPLWRARVRLALMRPDGLARVAAEAAAMGDARGALADVDNEAALADHLASMNIAAIGTRPLSEIAARLERKRALARASKPTDAQLDALAQLIGIEAVCGPALMQISALTAHGGFADAALARAALEKADAHVSAIAAAAPLPQETRFAPGLGRGLAYYDGFIFELEAPTLGARASLGGGGRYDALVKRLSGEDIAGAGFAVRPRRLIEARA